MSNSSMTITIEVTPDIAAKIRGMAEAGVFAIGTGNATLNFHEGVLKSIKTELFSYPKSYAQVETVDTLHPGIILT